MKAVIETSEGGYLIHLYGNDGQLCDTFEVENLYFGREWMKVEERSKEIYSQISGEWNRFIEKLEEIGKIGRGNR